MAARGIMRTQFAFTFGLLLASAAVGCGAVDDGSCPSDSEDDGIACTLDVCNAEAAGWAHLPNNNLCETGQRCDPTGGCVAAGLLTGHATLFGMDDNSGITVTVEGVEGATTMTDAAGNWSLGALPPGTFDVTYSKAGYVTIKDAGVGVTDVGASSPPDVELRAGYDVNHDAVAYWYNGFEGEVWSRSRKALAIAQSGIASGAVWYGYRLDRPSEPVTLYSGYVSPIVGDDYAAWVINDTVWSKSLTGGPAHLLATALPGDSFQIVGTVTQYVILRQTHYTGVFDQYNLFVVKADGSTPLGTPIYSTPDANHYFDGSDVWNNDTTALVGLSDYSGSPTASPFLRVDLATGTKTVVNAGLATSDVVFTSLSPDEKNVTGYLVSTGWDRGFLMTLDGTSQPSLAPDYGPQFSGIKHSDEPASDVTWLPDSSGAVYASVSYTKSDNATILEGGLKLWLVGQTQSVVLVPRGNYGPNQWRVHNQSVVFHDTDLVTSPLRVVSAHSTSPQIFPLDTSAFQVPEPWVDDSGGETYVVWTRSISAGDGTIDKIFASKLTPPITAAPQVVQLGGTVPSVCNFEAVLSDHTFWQLCNDTGVLNGYPELTMAPSTIMMVRDPLVAAPDADSVVYAKYDGRLYGSPNTGSLAESKVVSNAVDFSFFIQPVGPGVVFSNLSTGYLTSSAADGTTVDKPLTDYRPGFYSGFSPFFAQDPDRTHAWWFMLQGPGLTLGDFALPAENVK